MEKPLVVIKELKRAKIRFVVVGGVASTYYGVKRATFDLDLLLLPEVRELKKVIGILKRLHYKAVHKISNSGGTGRIIADINKVVPSQLVKHEAVRFIDDFNVDLMFPPNQAFFDFVWQYRFEISFNGLKFPLPNLVDLIRIKELSGRSKDMQDAKELRVLLRKNKNI